MNGSRGQAWRPEGEEGIAGMTGWINHRIQPNGLVEFRENKKNSRKKSVWRWTAGADSRQMRDPVQQFSFDFSWFSTRHANTQQPVREKNSARMNNRTKKFVSDGKFIPLTPPQKGGSVKLSVKLFQTFRTQIPRSFHSRFPGRFTQDSQIPGPFFRKKN